MKNPLLHVSFANIFSQLWLVLVTKVKFTLLVIQRPVNLRQGVEARNMALFGEPADREDGRLISHNTYFILVWMSDCFMDQRWWR